MALASQTAREIKSRKYNSFPRRRRRGPRRIPIVVALLAVGGLLWWLFSGGDDGADGNDPATDPNTALATADDDDRATPPARDADSLAPVGGTSGSVLQPNVRRTTEDDERRGGELRFETTPGATGAAPPPTRTARAEETPERRSTTSVPAVEETRTPPVRPSRGASGSSSAGSLEDAIALMDSDPLAARVRITRLIDGGGLRPVDASRARDAINHLGEVLLFDPNVLPADPFVARYSVQSGDTLAKIVKREGANVDWRFVQRINRIGDPSRIRIGQRLKLPVGAFHAIVHKRLHRLDLYLQNGPERVMVASWPVGLGEYDGTPTGTFDVRPDSKLINPQWRNPRTGEFFYADDPKNPLGERWIGLRGTSPETESLEAYGIHGTIDPASIGRDESMGCVRLLDPHVEIIYEVLVENASVIEIRP